MPCVLERDGYRIMIFVRDHDPAHVHVRKSGGIVVINIETGIVRDVWELSNREVRIARQIVQENREFLLSEWRRIGPTP